MLLVMVRDLLFSSKIDSAAKRSGAVIAWAGRGTHLADAARERGADAVLVDLGEPNAIEEIRALRSERPEVRVVAFTGHVRTDLLDEARSLGGVQVLTRGQLNASLEDVLVGSGRAVEPPR